MKLYQALKLKNKLAGEIKALEQLLLTKNSRIKSEENLFDIEKMFLELDTKRNDLIDLKSKISLTNTPIQSQIFQLSELKATAAFYSRLPTKQGTYKVNAYGAPDTQEFVAILNELEVDKVKKSLQERIEKLQEELDYFNHVTDLQ